MAELLPVPAYLSIVDYIVYAILFIVLAWSAYRDWKTNELPLWTYPVAVAIVTALRLFTGTMEWLPSILGALAAAATYWFMAAYFNGGGGDIIMMSAIGWCLGTINLLFVILFATLFYAITATIYCRYLRLNFFHLQLPYAPSVLFGMTVFVILDLIFHVSNIQRLGLYY